MSEIEPIQSSEEFETGAEVKAVRELDEVTYEPESRVENIGSVEQAEAIESTLKELVDTNQDIQTGGKLDDAQGKIEEPLKELDKELPHQEKLGSHEKLGDFNLPGGGMPGEGGMPGTGGMPGEGGLPGMGGMPGEGGIPGMGGMPGGEDIPGMGGMPGGDDIPGMGGMPGSDDFPGMGGMPGGDDFPGMGGIPGMGGMGGEGGIPGMGGFPGGGEIPGGFPGGGDMPGGLPGGFPGGDPGGIPGGPDIYETAEGEGGEGSGSKGDSGGSKGDSGGSKGDSGGQKGDTGGQKGDSGGQKGDSGGSKGSSGDKTEYPAMVVDIRPGGQDGEPVDAGHATYDSSTGDFYYTTLQGVLERSMDIINMEVFGGKGGTKSEDPEDGGGGGAHVGAAEIRPGMIPGEEITDPPSPDMAGMDSAMSHKPGAEMMTTPDPDGGGGGGVYVGAITIRPGMIPGEEITDPPSPDMVGKSSEGAMSSQSGADIQAADSNQKQAKGSDQEVGKEGNQ